MKKSQNDLKDKTLVELKNIANTNKIKFAFKIKKEDLIKLILEHSKLEETVVIKKEEFKDNNSSSITSSNINNQRTNDFFKDIPDLPNYYNIDTLVFMIRDPYWGFVYWETSNSLYSTHSLNDKEKYLRCYDISNSGKPENPDSYFDIKINDQANSWYINFPASNKTYFVDYGYFKDGQFVTVLRSNIGTLPRSELSDQVDVEWMMNDELYKNLMKASGADQLFQQSGSQELMKFLFGNVNETQSSGLMPSSVSSPFGASFSKK